MGKYANCSLLLGAPVSECGRALSKITRNTSVVPGMTRRLEFLDYHRHSAITTANPCLNETKLLLF